MVDQWPGGQEAHSGRAPSSIVAGGRLAAEAGMPPPASAKKKKPKAGAMQQDEDEGEDEDEDDEITRT